MEATNLREMSLVQWLERACSLFLDYQSREFESACWRFNCFNFLKIKIASSLSVLFGSPILTQSHTHSSHTGLSRTAYSVGFLGIGIVADSKYSVPKQYFLIIFSFFP